MHRTTHEGFRLLPLLFLTAAGCATTAGTVAGPVSAPIGFWQRTHGTPTWVKVALTPFTVPIGPFLGFVEGARADLGFVAHGEYGAGGSPAFGHAFDPLDPDG